MGKEAKIGLSIIGILVIVFAIVLGQKLLGSKDESAIAKNGKKTSQSAKKAGKKSGNSKGPRLSMFDTKGKPGSNRYQSGSKRKATPALAVSRNLHGTGGASTKSWSLTHGKPATASPLMPNPTGSTTQEAYQKTGSPKANDWTYSSTDYSSTDYSPSAGSRATNPRSGVAVLGSPPRSPYQSADDSYAASDNRYHSSTSDSTYHTYNSSGYDASNRYQPAPVGPRTGGARSDTGSYGRSSSRSGSKPTPSGYGSEYGVPNRDSSSYDRDSKYGGDSRYKSASYGPTDYGSSLSGGSDYDGGAQPNGTYTVKPHQNYWKISKDVYGTGAYFKALAEVNRNSIPDENRLKVGDQIKTPDLAELEQTYPELCPAPERRDTMRKRAEVASSGPRYGGSGRQYIVQSGDTLYDIARYELGDAARWTEIYELNRQVLQDSFDYLTPGLKLEVPNKNGKSSLTEADYDTSSQYGEQKPKHDNYYRTDTPRTATRPQRDYGGSNYGATQYQPSRTTYPRYETPSSNAIQASPYPRQR